MEFKLNETQTMIQDGARRFFQESMDTSKVRDIEESRDGFEPDLWAQMTKLGWTGAALPEDVGGGGCGNVDLCVLAEEMGRAAASMPLAETAGFAATMLQIVSQTPVTQDLLTRLATSDLVVTPALVELNGRDERSIPECTLDEAGTVGKINGTKILVPFASAAQTLLTSLISKTGDLIVAAVDIDTPGITMERHDLTGGAPKFRVNFKDVQISSEDILARGDDARKAVDAALDAATMLSIAEVVGSCEAIIKIATEYTGTREQFGKKIGSFQAVAHPIANMRVNTDACRLLIAEAAWMLDQGQDASLEIAETKVFANEVVVDMVHAAHAAHGAIGYTMEYDLQLHTRRSRAFCLNYGDTLSQTERAATAMGL